MPKETEESVQDPSEHPKGPQRDPKNNESRGYGGPFWAPLAACKRTPKGPPRHPWGTEGAAKTAPHKKPEPLDKNAEDKKRTTNKRFKSDRYLRGCCAHALRGAFFGDAAARRKHSNHHVAAVLDPKGAKTLENLLFYEGS